MTPIDPRLDKLLGGDELTPLRRRLRRCYERAAAGSPPDLVRLNSLNAAEREALALFTGRPPGEARSMQIDIQGLDARLRDAGIAMSLRDALEQIDGPIVQPALLRTATQASWHAVAATDRHPALAGYLRSAAALGVLKRLARNEVSAAGYLLEAADAVLRRLPAGGLARAQLAAQILGDAHALDKGQPIATLVLAAWRHGENAEPRTDDPDQPPDDRASALPDGAPDERVRDVWARAGVLVNELSRPALFMNLPVGAGNQPVCVAGEPAYLSLRQLMRSPPRWGVAGQTVFVCENPNLVAMAADELGADCAALVCTDGMPASAQRTLLTQLARAGACLRYHGDFDWPGVTIANHVISTWAARPWRFGARDYEAAAAVAPHTRRTLDGTRITAHWDASLAPAMQQHGLAIAEEALAASLFEDLRRT